MNSPALCVFIALLCLARGCSADFKYIVVGAGPAGCAVSAGLADDGSSVLVLEAGQATMWEFGGRNQKDYFTQFGGDTSVTVFDVPFEHSKLGEYGSYWWDTAPWTRQGKGIGGSGAVNAGLAFKGVPQDFETWPPGWSYGDLNGYYEEAIGKMGVSAFQSTDGKLYNQEAGDALDSVMQNQFGFEKRALNGPGPRAKSTSNAEYYVKGGQRFESCLTFLRPALNSGDKNIKLMTDSTVKRIILSEMGQALGVELIDGTEILVSLGGKVILAAGPLNTPKVLMYSGIGPSKELERLNAKGLILNPEYLWVKNEEVGVGMHDHMAALIQVKAPDGGKRTAWDPTAAQDFFNSRSNYFTQFGVSRLAFMPKPGSTNPDIEVWASSFTSFGQPGVCDSCFEFFVMPMQPKSRGNLQIKTDDLDCPCGGQVCRTGDFCSPLKYLSNPADVDDMIWAVKTVANGFAADGYEVVTPAAIDDAGVRAYVGYDPRSTLIIRHHGGSCALGRCTDGDLKVKGTQNIFVVDSSTFPTPISAHNVLTTIAIGRKAVNHVRYA